MEDAYRNLKGVVSATVGYAGGTTLNPTYGDVCSGTTGHTEVLEVQYDQEEISYDSLLSEFWSVHDPTTNLIGYHGGQYKSVIYYSDEQQALIAKDSLETRNKLCNGLICTQILPAQKFYRAEEYHQQYYDKHRTKACR